MKTKPWLWLSPSLSHNLAPLALQIYGSFKDFQTLTWKPFQWRGLEFTNPLGTAGGLDKNADLIQHFWTLGVGFVEVGTVTPLRQSSNPGQTINRDDASMSLWNKLGFPNQGFKSTLRKLKKLKQPHFTPVLVNIGKNRSVSLENAHLDYIKLVQELHEYSDIFVINISSPNTNDLRKIFEPEILKSFLDAVLNAKKEKDSPAHTVPILLKLSPDLEDKQLHSVLDISLQAGIDGWVMTNTTTMRPKDSKFPAEGGLSGKPLAELSKNCLQKTIQYLGNRRGDKLIISVGGVLTAQDVFERLAMGANLVQTYSGLVYNGPFFFKSTCEEAKRQYY